MQNTKSALSQAMQSSTPLFDGVIFDEAHKLRNEKTQTCQQCKRLVDGIRHRWLLTGTVIINKFCDVYNLFRFLEIPNLSPSWFQSTPVVTVEVANQKNHSSDSPVGPSTEEETHSPIIPTERDRLAQRDRYYYRLTKEQCLQDLPEKHVQTHQLTFDESHYSDYFEIYLEVKELYKVAQNTRKKEDWAMLLVKILRLRQSCNHPEAILNAQTRIEAPIYQGPTPAKFQKILEIVKAMPHNDRLIIFSQWTTSLQLVGQYLTQHGYSSLEYNGSMGISARNQVLSQFETASSLSPKILLISLTAGGIGLNLTSANHVILLDQWWNSAIEEQAIDRVYRLGQTKPVEVHRLIMKDSIENWMWKMKEEKNKVDQSFHQHSLMDEIDTGTLTQILRRFI